MEKLPEVGSIPRCDFCGEVIRHALAQYKGKAYHALAEDGNCFFKAMAKLAPKPTS